MSGRAIGLFDLAKMILGGRERFEIVFLRDKEDPKATELVRCAADGSVWIDEEEAIRHFLSDKRNLEKYYQVEETKTDGPKGDFKSIVGGISS